MKNQKIKKTVILTTFRCNNNCRFCIQQDVRNRETRTTDQIKVEMLNARKRGSTYLEMIGGEIAIRDDFIELVEFANNLKFETIMIATNGRMFSYRDYAFRAIKAGLNSIIFSIHGPDSETHDYLTRVKGSFNQLHKGLKNIKAAGEEMNKNIQLGVNSTVVKKNYKKLPETGRHIKNLGIKNTEFIFVDCNEGGALNNFNELVPKISEAAPYIRECLDLVDVGKRSKANWDIRYVPLCYFTDYLDQVSEINEVATFQTEQIGRDEGQNSGYDYEKKRKEIARIKPDKCKKCVLYDYCEGLWVGYYERFGGEELNPIDSIDEDKEKKLKSLIG